MEQEKEETLAAILWRFIEEIREQERPGLVLRLAPAEAHELLALLTFAAGLRDALAEAESPAEEHGRARQQLERALREPPARPRVTAGAEPGRRSPAPLRPALPRPRWTWGAAAAAVALAAGLVGMRVGRSLPPPDPLNHPPASVAALSHARVRQWLPRLLEGQLSPDQARAMWWHLAHCDDCFHAYEQMRGPAPRRAIGALEGAGLPTFISLRVGGNSFQARRAD